MREHFDTLRLVQYIASLNEIARRAGIEIELRTDFGHLMELCEKLPDKPAPTAMFNPLKADIGSHNGFWLKGTDSNGVPVHVQAVRVYDMNGTNLAREFKSLRVFYANPDLAPNGERCDSAAPMAERITGTVCYHAKFGSGAVSRICGAKGYPAPCPDCYLAWYWPGGTQIMCSASVTTGL